MVMIGVSVNLGNENKMLRKVFGQLGDALNIGKTAQLRILKYYSVFIHKLP